MSLRTENDMKVMSFQIKKVALGFAFMYNIHQNQACYVFYQLCYAIHHVTFLVIM